MAVLHLRHRSPRGILPIDDPDERFFLFISFGAVGRNLKRESYFSFQQLWARIILHLIKQLDPPKGLENKENSKTRKTGGLRSDPRSQDFNFGGALVFRRLGLYSNNILIVPTRRSRTKPMTNKVTRSQAGATFEILSSNLTTIYPLRFISGSCEDHYYLYYT